MKIKRKIKRRVNKCILLKKKSKNMIRRSVLIILLLVMNLFDLYLTVFFIKYFDFEEVNPVAQLLINQGIGYLIAFKIIVVSFSLSVLSYFYNKSRISLWACWFLVFVFAALMIYWTVFLTHFNESMGF